MGYDTHWDTFNCIKIKDYKKVKEIINECEYSEIFKFSSYVDSESGLAIWSLSVECSDGSSSISHCSIYEMDVLPDLCKYLEDFELIIYDHYSIYENGDFYKIFNKDGEFKSVNMKLTQSN